MSVTILTRDDNLHVTGMISSEQYTSLTAQIKFNETGVWTLTVPAFPDVVSLLAPSSGIIIIHNGEVFASGPMDQNPFQQDGAADAGPGTVTFQGSTDLAAVANRLVFPDPTQDANHQTAVGSYDRSGVAAGTLITDLVRLNASTQTPTAAGRLPVPIAVTPSTLGSVVSMSERFTPLSEVLQALALAGGGLGYRCGQMGATGSLSTSLLFEVYQPRDLSRVALFSMALGNLRTVNYAEIAPLVTRAIVGGTGTGATRPLSQYVNADAESYWGRSVESFVDQSSTADPVLLAQAGAAALAAGSEQVQLTSVTVDSPTLRYGRDDPANGIIGYGLGDKVSVQPQAGAAAVTDLVRQVTLTYDASAGELVTALVGDPSATASVVPAYVRQIRALERRLSKLERI